MSGEVVSLRDRVADKLRFDLMARARRPWRVEKYPTLIEESRARPGQLRIGRSWEQAQGEKTVEQERKP